MKTDTIEFFLVPTNLARIVIGLSKGLERRQEIMAGDKFHCCGLDEYHT